LSFLAEAEKGKLNFSATEVEILTLLTHYECFFLENHESPVFDNHSKKKYINKIKSIVKDGGRISRGDILLSSIVSEEVRKLIIKMEKDL